MRITSKGQVTIPQHVREQLGLLPHAEVEFIVEGNAVRIVKAAVQPDDGRAGRVLGVLAGSATATMSTDEIMALTRHD